MRWFPDKVRVLFHEVVIDLKMLIALGCLFRNVSTSLYSMLPSPEAKFEIKSDISFIVLTYKDNINKGNAFRGLYIILLSSLNK